MFQGFGNCRFSDLMKCYSLKRDFILFSLLIKAERFYQMPGDGLSFPVEVGSQINFLDIVQGFFYQGEVSGALSDDLIVGGEIVMYVHRT